MKTTQKAGDALNRKTLIVILVLLAAGTLIGTWYFRRSGASKTGVAKGHESTIPVSPPVKNEVKQEDQLRSVEELRILYPDLFNRLDTSVYEGQPFDGSDALHDFHQVPFGRKTRDAYEAMVRAVAVQLRTVPDECLAQMTAYDVASGADRYDLDLGDLPTKSLHSFLKVRSALVEGLVNEGLPQFYKRAALNDVQMTPRIFATPSLVRQLQAFGNSSRQDSATARDIVTTIQSLPPFQAVKVTTSGASACKLKQ